MKTWWAILEVIRFRPMLFLINVMAGMVLSVAMQVPGLAMREFFNLLSGEEAVRVGILGIVTVLAVGGLVTLLGFYLARRTLMPLNFSVAALLQKNMLAHILGRPGAVALPDSPGEAISRFRGDVGGLHGFPIVFSNVSRAMLSSALALTIMLTINWHITLFAFLPIAARSSWE